jgi:hypothetical protein
MNFGFCFCSALLLGSLCIDQNLELAHVRAKINDLMQDRNYSSAQSGADNTCVTTTFVSLDWCFVDCKSACLNLSNLIRRRSISTSQNC